MTDKKVLIVTQLYPPESGGNASRISDTAENLRKLGVGVSILSPPPTFPFGSFPRTWRPRSSKTDGGTGVVNLWTWQPSRGDPGFLSRMAYYLLFAVHASLWSLAHARRYDVIITSAPPIFIYIAGLLPSYLFRKPWIADVRDLWIDASISLGFIRQGSFQEQLSRRFEKLCYSRADAICVTTEEMKKKILARYGSLSPDKIAVVANGVDTGRFCPCAARGARRLIYAGNVGHAQDLEKAVLAVGLVARTHAVELLIVGEGDMKAPLMRLVKERGLESCVRFMDLVPREEVPQLISGSFAGLAPLKELESLEYAIPSKVYEYMACGVPFVGCSRGEIVNIARRSGAGVVAGNGVEAFAEVISGLLDDPERAAEMGRNGREYAVRYCDRKAMAESLKAIVEQLGAGLAAGQTADGSMTAHHG